MFPIDDQMLGSSSPGSQVGSSARTTPASTPAGTPRNSVGVGVGIGMGMGMTTGAGAGAGMSPGGAGAGPPFNVFTPASPELGTPRLDPLITPMSHVPGCRMVRHLGTLSLYLIKETTSLRDTGGVARFIQLFVSEV